MPPLSMRDMDLCKTAPASFCLKISPNPWYCEFSRVHMAETNTESLRPELRSIWRDCRYFVNSKHRVDLTGEICTRWNERESTWREIGSCPCRGTSQNKS